MRTIILFGFLICFSKIYSQNIEKRIGCFEITKKGYFYSDLNLRKKRNKSEFYFDEDGKILEKITYGRHHYFDLKLIGGIDQFFYNNDILEMSKSYTSSCKTCDFNLYYTKYNYNKNKVLISENGYFGRNDSLFRTINYINESNIVELDFNGSTIDQKVYDSLGRIIEYNQLFKDTRKIRWQYLYEYNNDCKIGSFQTYYGDGKEHSKKEIECFDQQNRIISKEIIAGYKTKILYEYSDEGFLRQIKEFNSFNDEEYELEYVFKFKIKGNSEELNFEILNKINAKLLYE